MPNIEDTHPGLTRLCRELAEFLHVVNIALGGEAEASMIIMLPINGVKSPVMLLQSKPEELIAALQSCDAECVHSTVSVTSNSNGEDVTSTIIQESDVQ
jgi:hypothetical protein